MAPPKVSSRRRISVIVIAMTTVMLLTLVFRVGYWQIYKADWLKQKAADQWTRELTVEPKRGSILDTYGTVLAQSASSYMVVLRPKEIEDYAKKQALKNKDPNYAQTLSKELASLLGVDEALVLRRALDTKKSEVLIKRQITTEEKNAVLEKNLAGVHLSADMTRFYPMRDFATQILGFTSIDGDGQEGIESRYNKYLRGTEGSILSETDAQGRAIPDSVESYIPPVDGDDVVLTIDAAMQSFAENAAGRALTEQNAKGVEILVLDPNTMQILASAQKPSFDNNAPPREDLEALRAGVRNSAIADAYEPGSTFKILTVAAGLDAGVISTNTHFYCPGYKIVDGERIRCWTHSSHGDLDLFAGVQKSCNPVFMTIALALGQDRFYDYLDRFGIGKATGIQLYGEASGIMMAPKYVRNVDLARIGFGQAIAVTPLQLATSVSAIINGGKLIKPTIVKEIRSPSGEVIESFQPEVIGQVIKPQTSETMREILRSVVDKGSGKHAHIDGYSVGGKTGTAQKYGPDGKIMADKHISSFIAFAPADKPKYLVLVIVDEPNVAVDYGSIVAAPYAKMILEQALQYGNVPPDVEPDKDDVDERKDVPDEIGKNVTKALSDLQAEGFQGIVEGFGGEVADQMPKPGSEAAPGSTVILYLKQVDDQTSDSMQPVPDVTDMPAVEANNAIQSMGFRMKAKGTGGVAVGQNPEPGTPLLPGETVEVTFAPANDEGDDQAADD